MNLIKHREFFDPEQFNDEVHIIGCGAVGSTIAEQLTRLGFKKLHIYDFDTVSEHNITNQMFLHKHIGISKLDALDEICHSINPEIQLMHYPNGWKKGMPLSGYVILAVDSIDTRNEIVDDNYFNPHIKAVYDVRMRLVDAQHFAAKWDTEGKKFLKQTMAFTSEEANAATPMSACGTTLSVTPTVRIISSYAVCNLINTIQRKHIARSVLIDTFTYGITAFDENGEIE